MKKQKKGGNRRLENVIWSYGKVGAVISTAVSALGTAAVGLFGGWDKALQTLIFFMVMDFVLGTLAAMKNGELSSKTAFWGGVNKLIVLCLVAVGVMLDGVLPLREPYCRTAVICFYIGREGLSLLENYGKLGGEMPEFLRRLLAQMKDYGDSGAAQEATQKTSQEKEDNKNG